MKNNETNEVPIRVRPVRNPSDMSEGPMGMPPPPRRRRKFARFFTFVLLIAVIALGYLYYKQTQELNSIKDPQVRAEMEQKETTSLITKVSKLILLPADENPQVFTINDAAAAVKEQPAFTGVVDGDKIMLYTKSNRAVIYSPSRNIIVNVIPVTISGNGVGTTETKAVKTSSSTSNDEETVPKK